MIFEITYNELQLPLALIKELVTDKEYKGDVKTIVFEVTKETVFLSYHDHRLGVRVKAELKGATPELSGTATCSLASFFEMVKVFKKSEEPLLVEREGETLRIDDGVYPEEVMHLRKEEAGIPLPDTALTNKVVGVPSTSLSEGIQLALTIARKTEIPSGDIDTQAVYLSGQGAYVHFNAFSLHNYQSSKRLGIVYAEHMVQLTKPVATAIAKVAHAGRKEVLEWVVSEVDGLEQVDKGILLESMDGSVALFFEAEALGNPTALTQTFHEIEENFRATMEAAPKTSPLKADGIGKVKAEDNIIFVDGNAEVNSSGYPATLIKKLQEKGAWGEDGLLFYTDGGLGAQPPICFYTNEKGEEKITVVSYREAPVA